MYLSAELVFRGQIAIISKGRIICYYQYICYYHNTVEAPLTEISSVSYTHLDVYKRQDIDGVTPLTRDNSRLFLDRENSRVSFSHSY